jgi:predicted TIM-barrel fold metal-dependent hydrolase
MTVWVDSEVHLLPPEWCRPDHQPRGGEDVLQRVVYDHPEREAALSQATAEGLMAEMERAGIDRAVIMGLPWRDPGLCWQNNAYIAQVVREHPGRFTGLGVLPPPGSTDLRDAVRRVAEEYGLEGVKVIPSWQGYRLDDGAFAPALGELVVREMVLVPHTDHLFVPPGEADTAYALYAVGRRYPELKVMAPHLGGLLCLYALHPPVKPALGNMLFVTSVPTTMQMVTFAVKAVGARRVAFGTDFPFNPSHDQRSLRRALEALPLDEDDRRLVAGENTLRFFGEAGHQPVYLPWLGLFHKIALADVFIFMDDVQYLEQDWNNRNRVKGPQGAFWLTVPVRLKDSPSKLLKDIRIASDGWGSKKHWQRLHWRSLQTCYSGALYWETYAPFFEELYTRKPWEWLVDVNKRMLHYLLDALGIEVEFVRASEYGFEGEKSDLVLDHCRKLEADVCVLGMHGRDYLVEEDFFKAGVSIYYQDYQHPRYNQRFGDFISHLTVVDLLFNCGPESRSVLLSGNVSPSALRVAARRQFKAGVVQPSASQQ